MREFTIALFSLFVLTVLISSAEDKPKPKGVRNEDIYPPAEAAEPFINFDNKGFIVNGQRTYIASGSIHYARVPPELWADRLLRLKQASFNCVQTYCFWNYHEPVKGQWNFTGNADVEKFLETAQKTGLYATVRPGPYVCAEWDSGGYPVWLRFEPNLTSIRTNAPNWLALNDHWYNKILPLIAKHQINHGGNVILVQLENEHPLGWGVIPDDPYFVHLHEVAVKDGIEVPHFMSGLNHGGGPSPSNINPTTRKTPWYSTEFWAGWFDAYRVVSNKKFRQIVTANWNIMGHGGAGQNYYMIHGGSNFAFWSDDSTGASYDYGAAIGQCGELRPMYYQMKRANQLAQSFPNILSNSTDALPSYKDFVSGENVSVNGARQSDAGTLVFLQNNSNSETTATFKTGETLRMTRYSNYPLPQNVTLGDGVKIVDSTVPVLAVMHNDHVITIIVYSQPGDTGRLTLATLGEITAGRCSSSIVADLAKPAQLNLKIKFPENGVEECTLHEGDNDIRVLAINQDLSLFTWILGLPQKSWAVFGPNFVQSVEKSADGKLAVTLERPYASPSCGQVAVYGGKDESWHLGVKANTGLESQPAPTLANWQMLPQPQNMPAYDDSTWMQSDEPLPMGADGDYGAFSWYRSTINIPSAGNGDLNITGKDNLEVFVNGQHVDGNHDWKADFIAGKNSIAVFASHKGRQKAFAYLGPLNNYDSKGITGPVTLEIGGQKMEVKGWKLQGGPDADISMLKGWAAPEDTHGVPAFYEATFQSRPPDELGAHPILRVNYTGLKRGMIWVNGHSLGRYPEKIRIGSLYIPECWLKDGENVLTVFDETGASPTQIQLSVEQASSREVIRTSDPIDPSTPIGVPLENKVIDLVALNRGNLAYQRPVIATYTSKMPGSTTVEDDKASAVTDGDPDSGWGPPSPKEQALASVQVDLGQPTSVKVCEVLFDGAANGYKYVLEGSSDGKTWTKLGDQSTAVATSPDSPSELTRLNLDGDAWRYLRVTITSGKNFTINEFRAFTDAK